MNETIITQRTATTTFDYCGKPATLHATAKLYSLGRQEPYFSVTGEIRVRSMLVCCGCIHKEIAERLPSWLPAIALHLSDSAGEPMHSEANGWYWMAGALTRETGELYTGRTSEQTFPLPADRLDATKPWMTTEHREPTRDECLAIWARHVRVDMATAKSLRASICRRRDMRNEHREIIALALPRWKAEAATILAWLREPKA